MSLIHVVCDHALTLLNYGASCYMLLLPLEVTILLVPLESFREELCIVEHFIIFKSMEQKLLNLEWFFSLKFNSIFSINQIFFHHIGPFGWLSHPKSQHLGPMTLEFTLGSIKGVYSHLLHTWTYKGSYSHLLHTWAYKGSYSHLLHTLMNNIGIISTNQWFFIILIFLFVLMHHMGKCIRNQSPIGHPIHLFISSPFTLDVFLKALKRFFEKL
jgi:hypothetical protein